MGLFLFSGIYVVKLLLNLKVLVGLIELFYFVMMWKFNFLVNFSLFLVEGLIFLIRGNFLFFNSGVYILLVSRVGVIDKVSVFLFKNFRKFFFCIDFFIVKCLFLGI